jgi:hypothetical protein
MNRTPPENFENAIAGLLEPQPSLDLHRKPLRQLDGAVAIKEIRSMEQMDMEHMAFDPFGAVNEPPQHRDLRMDLHS